MGLFKRKEPEYEEENLEEEEEELPKRKRDGEYETIEDEDELVYEEEKPIVKRSEIVRPKVKPSTPQVKQAKERYSVGYQPEILFVVDAENPNEPIVVNVSRKLEKNYPLLTLQVKQLNDLDRLTKSV